MKLKPIFLYRIYHMLFLLSIFLPIHLSAQVKYDKTIPQLAFAAQELESALKEAGKEELKVSIIINKDDSKPEAFQIKTIDSNQIEIIGTDAKGAMYGGLEVAELIKLGLPIKNQNRVPFIEKRGIKFNIPWDARTPSYDDTGDAAQINIETMWDFEFWKAYLDDLARYRYNVLTLWGNHHYPSIIKLEEYPDVALDDVYRIRDGVFEPHHRNKLQDIDFNKPGVLEQVKKITIDEKIAHWQKVFNYAGDRGIEIYLFHWNVFTFGATGKHGITQEQTNPVTIDYLRKSVRQALLTYPQIKGIGVTAGENADNHLEGEFSIRNFLFNTYGRAMMDVLEEQPDRELRFIFRQHMTGLGPMTEAFSNFEGEFNTSFKYAIGHMYTVRKPLLFDRGFRKEVEEYRIPCWLNLRNDDMFVLRWGNPDYVRDYIKEMPLDVMPGFYMGSDGYVWGREFISKNPETAGRLEIDKHWYRFRMWGQLTYNPELGRDYWEATLEHRFPGVNAKLLYDAWAATGEIVPQINAALFKPNDAMFAPEGCIEREGFLTVDRYYFDKKWNKPMVGSGILSITEWANAIFAGEKPDEITPLQVADNLDEYAANALAIIPELREQADNDIELLETLNDIEAMAYLGRYYADKMRGAAKLALFRKDIRQKQFNSDAVDYLKDAVKEWKIYAAIVSSQYKPQLMQRTHYMDWNKILLEVEKEVETIAREGDYPEIHFTNLKNGARFCEGTNLDVNLDVTDKDGVKEVMLYLNGLLLKSTSDQKKVWNSSGDELLKDLKPGIYHLKAVAEDNTGTFGRREIKIIIGDVSGISVVNYNEEIHQVIFNDGERLMDGEVSEFPRLDCYLFLNEDGRLVLHAGSPGNNKGQIWQATMHRDYRDPQFATLEKGQLKIYRGSPQDIEATLFETPSVYEKGSYKLGITVSKRLVIYREAEGNEKEIVWKSEEPDS